MMKLNLLKQSLDVCPFSRILLTVQTSDTCSFTALFLYRNSVVLPATFFPKGHGFEALDAASTERKVK